MKARRSGQADLALSVKIEGDRVRVGEQTEAAVILVTPFPCRYSGMIMLPLVQADCRSAKHCPCHLRLAHENIVRNSAPFIDAKFVYQYVGVRFWRQCPQKG